MDPITINDIVAIVKVDKGPQHLFARVGRLVLIADGVRGVVVFSDGTGAEVTLDQLEKVG